MRIRKRWPRPPICTAFPIAEKVSNHISERGSQYHNPFLVEEENRRIGWSFYPREESCNHETKGDQQEAKLQLPKVTRGEKSLKCVDEKKVKNYHMEKKPAPGSKGQGKEKARKQRRLNSFTNYQRTENQSHTPVSVVLALPSTSSRPVKPQPASKSLQRQEEREETYTLFETIVKQEMPKGLTNSWKKKATDHQPTKEFVTHWHGASRPKPWKNFAEESKWDMRREGAVSTAILNLHQHKEEATVATNVPSMNGEKQKPKRGRPKKIRDQPVN
ncbi:uncharacterized protein LOC131149330 isoform X2 [Malania oleifera]|uniref:uncharacterized protein LOC131149330 isoform X2 n=1 Tax=Malania oleifera TaxID=397392 RepID=UPI0025AE59F1|nr:uncharacterized protein LOC131149330 isoform X2 [Malania oleifera]